MPRPHIQAADDMQTEASRADEPLSALRRQGPASSVQHVDQLGELSVLFEPSVNVAVYRRTLTPTLLTDARRAASVLGSRLMLAVSTVAGAARQLHEHLPALPHLAADVARWVELLADLTGSTQIGVRLAYLESPMCPRLHVDRVTLRVVTTYFGAGTEYAASEDVQQPMLGRGALTARKDESALVRAGAKIQRAEAGYVVMLKGEAWPGNVGLGAVHRSPPASALAPRFVLTLDAL